MASKGPQVQESVVERRLRPIYDYLDTANNKKALQECDKVLKKSPNLQCAKALRAVCLLRLGKEAESAVILEGLTLEPNIDDPTILAMSICYRELQQYSKVCVLYERAVKTDPSNEESHTQLFMSYVRVGNFKAQQQSALALYKHKQKNPYYCWAVMSVILQATRGPESSSPQKRLLLLSLAEKMIHKLENKFQADQEVQLYHLVLQLQRKHEEILELLDGEHGCKVSGDTQYNRLAPLRALNRWPEVNLTCKRILCEHVDNWTVWKEYLESVFHLRNVDEGKTNGDVGCKGSDGETDDDLGQVDDTADKAHEFVCRVIEMEATNAYCLRGPYLARFELARHLQSDRSNSPAVSEILGSLPDLFVEYFRRFGQRPSCVPDMRMHLPLLTLDERLEVARTCLGARDFGNGDEQEDKMEWEKLLPESETQLLRHIHASQLARLCSLHAHTPPSTLMPSLLRYYAHGNTTFRLDRLSTDLGPADPYVILAAQTLADGGTQGCSPREGGSGGLVEAVKLLDELADESKSNFHGKLLGIRYYHVLGGALGAAQIYDSLDVKHLQLDSLGFLHCARLPATGLITHANHIYEITLKFFTSNYKDNMDHLTFLYKYGSFMKLDEFMDFRERMGNSLHYATISAEKFIINLLQTANLDALYIFEANFSKEPLPVYDILRDNSDYNVYQSFDPERVTCVQQIEDLKEQLFKSDIALLQLRYGVLSAISAAILLVKMAADSQQQNNHISNLKTTVQTLEHEHKRIELEYKKRLGEEHKDFSCLLLPYPSRLDCLLQVESVPLILSFLQFFLSVQSDAYDSSQKLSDAILSSLFAISESQSEHIRTENESLDIFSTRRATLEFTVNVVEVLNLATVLLVLTLELVKDKRAKKLAKMRELVLNLAANLKETLNCVDCVLVSWYAGGSLIKDDVATVVDKMQSLQLTTLDTAALPSKFSVQEQLYLTHAVAVKELRAVLRAKIKMLL